MAERADIATRTRGGDEAIDRSAHEIRNDIAAKRESISETVDKLGERIQETLDWREYIGQYPFASLGIAAGIGLLVSSIFKHRPTPQERITDAVAETLEDVSDRFRSSLGDVIPKKTGSSRTIKAAATAALTKAAMDFAHKKLNETLKGRGTAPPSRQPAASLTRGTERAGFDDTDIQVSRATTTT